MSDQRITTPSAINVLLVNASQNSFFAAVILLYIEHFVNSPTNAHKMLDQGQRHVVQPGESLFRIGLRYGLSVDELVTANNIVDRNLVWVGQQLVIPAK